MRLSPLLFGLLLLIGLASPSVSANEARGHCQAPVGRDFPAASLEVGALAGPLLKINEALDAGKHDFRSLLVVRNCKLIFERYKDGIGRDHNHTIYSVTKSFASTLVGALLHSGKLKSIDEPIAALLEKPPSLADEAWTANNRITLRNVMQMSSGLEYFHDPANNPIYRLKSDRLAVALATKALAEPGTKYNYSDGDASVTGAMIAAASGKDLYNTAKELLFVPLEMVNHDWWFMDLAGRYPGGWGLRLRPMDMAKLGQLYLQGCNWNGQQICDRSYVAMAWTAGPSKYYGLHWWIGRTATGLDYFYASGVKGQRIFVLPALGIVAAITSITPLNEMRGIEAMMFAAIAEAPADAGPPDEAVLAQLAKVQKTGFTGRNRSLAIEDQDYPRPPR